MEVGSYTWLNLCICICPLLVLEKSEHKNSPCPNVCTAPSTLGSCPTMTGVSRSYHNSYRDYFGRRMLPLGHISGLIRLCPEVKFQDRVLLRNTPTVNYAFLKNERNDKDTKRAFFFLQCYKSMKQPLKLNLIFGLWGQKVKFTNSPAPVPLAQHLSLHLS